MPLRFWDFIRRQPWLALAGFTALQTAFTLSARALWFSDEVRYAEAYAGLLRGNWLVLSLNGVAYPDKPPLYFWLLRALDVLTGIHDPAVFFLGTAVSGLLMIYATLVWARVLRLPGDAGPLAGLVLLSTLFFAGLLHYSRMDLLFGALIVASQAAFCLAFRPGGPAEEAKRSRRVALAMLLAALATLTKGPLGLAFPILTTLAYLAWRGRAREFFRAAMLRGLGVLLLVVFSWVAAAYFIQGPLFLRKIFVEQIFQRATNTFHHAEHWYFYLIAFPPCWLPWTLAPVALPVRRLFASDYWRGLWAGRKNASPEADARLWLWLSALSGLGLLSILSGKVVVYLLPQLAPLALLLALALRNARLPWHRLWTASALLFLVLAAAASQAERFLPVPLSPEGGLPGAGMVASGFASCAIALFLLRRHDARQVLPALAILTALWVQPACQTLAPALDIIMSPKPQAMVLKSYAQQGYTPLAHDIYQGIYSYYLGAVINESADFRALDAFVAEHDTVLVIKKKKWDIWTTKPANMVKVFEQWMAGQPYYVAVGRKDGSSPPVHELPATP